MLVAKVPLRISLFGGGTDYPEYYTRFPGAVLGGTIDQYIYIFMNELAPIAEQNYRITYRQVESVQSIEEIRHPVVRAVLQHFEVSARLNIATFSDLPGGTGLGSSSAFTVGMISLIAEYLGLKLSPEEIAKKAFFIEHEVLGDNVGIQDQTHAAFGGFARYDFHEAKIEKCDVGLTAAKLTELNSSLLLVYTGGVRSASKVLAEQRERTARRINDSTLALMYEQVCQGERAVRDSQAEHLSSVLGNVLREAWQFKKSLGSGVTNPIVDTIFDQGMEMGAYGGKLLGAGGEGFVLFIVDKSLRIELMRHFGSDRCVVPNFVSSGVEVRRLQEL